MMPPPPETEILDIFVIFTIAQNKTFMRLLVWLQSPKNRQNIKTNESPPPYLHVFELEAKEAVLRSAADFFCLPYLCIHS